MYRILRVFFAIAMLSPATPAQAAVEETSLSTTYFLLGTAVQLCYTGRYRNNTHDKMGYIELRWTINNSGFAQSLEFINDTIQHKESLRCVFKMMEAFRFPKPYDNEFTIVTHTFEIYPKESAFNAATK